MRLSRSALRAALGASVVCLPADVRAVEPTWHAPPAARESSDSLDALAGTLDGLLEGKVRGDRVDYHALGEDRSALEAWVARLAGVEAEDLEDAPRAEQIAFWINAYNGITLLSVLRHQPLEELPRISPDAPARSIRQIPDVWKTPHAVAGRRVSLDQIEHEILRGRFREARIHFAINCASVGCPPLRNEAFRGSRLDAQLDEQARSFVRDPERNRIDPGTGTVKLSRLFEWFGEDFGGPEAFRTARANPSAVRDFLVRYVPEEKRAFVKGVDPAAVAYLDYDWSLNDTAGGSP